MRTLIITFIAVLTGCRSDRPPAMTICILDEFGGGYCVNPHGQREYKYPSSLKNFWAANAADMQNFISWCYNATQSEAFLVKKEFIDLQNAMDAE